MNRNPSPGSEIEPEPLDDVAPSSHTAAPTQLGRIQDMEEAHQAEIDRVTKGEGLQSLQDANTLYPDETDLYSYVLTQTGFGTLMTQVFHEDGSIRHRWHGDERENE